MSDLSTAVTDPLFSGMTTDAVKNQYQVMEEKNGKLDEKNA